MIHYNDTDYICHHGVKGMKWGVRRYVDKNGKLTSEGKTHVNRFSRQKMASKTIEIEGNRLMNKSKSLKRDFGGDISKVDDPDYFEYVARTKYGLNTDNFNRARKEYSNYSRQNSKSIKRGKKIVKKYFNNKMPKDIPFTSDKYFYKSNWIIPIDPKYRKTPAEPW